MAQQHDQEIRCSQNLRVPGLREIPAELTLQELKARHQVQEEIATRDPLEPKHVADKNLLAVAGRNNKIPPFIQQFIHCGEKTIISIYINLLQ